MSADELYMAVHIPVRFYPIPRTQRKLRWPIPGQVTTVQLDWWLQHSDRIHVFIIEHPPDIVIAWTRLVCIRDREMELEMLVNDSFGGDVEEPYGWIFDERLHRNLFLFDKDGEALIRRFITESSQK